MRELRVELLEGRKLVDRNGKRVGHIEEFVAEYRGGDLIVTEVHLGRAGLIERFSLHGSGEKHERRPSKVRWSDIDFSDPDHPRLKVAVEEL